MAEKPSQEPEMSVAAEMRDSIAAVAGERRWDETREAWLSRAARACRLPYRTVKALFYQEIPDPRFSVVQAVRDAARKVAVTQEIETATEYEQVTARLARIEARLAALDEDKNRARTNQERPAQDRMGRVGCSVDQAR